MDGHDVGPGPEVGVTDQGIELPAGFDQAAMDKCQALKLLGCVPAGAQESLLVSRGEDSGGARLHAGSDAAQGHERMQSARTVPTILPRCSTNP